MTLFWLWVLLAVSWLLWLFIYFRVRFVEKTFPAIDSTTPTPEPASAWPFISILVPGRNEEKDVAASLSTLAKQDYPGFEIIFIDDESTDRTMEIARAVLAGHPDGQVIAGKPRPSDRWIGKNWALAQGYEKARGDWLLFADADVTFHPSAVRKAMAAALQLHVDALSLLPSIDCHSFWEKSTMPLFATLSVLIEPMDRTNHPEKQGSRLAGAFLLIRRDAYEDVGGHRAVSDRIVEDMALAQKLKEHGHTIWLTYTKDLAHTRMYDSLRDLWKGLSRLSFPMLRYSVVLLLAAYGAAFFCTLVPWLALVFGTLAVALGYCGGIPMAILGALLCLFSRYALKRIFTVVRINSGYAWLLPLAASLYCLAATYAAFCHFTGKGIGWKQRVYHHS